uniref:strawberry notch C-terminal domain-containing protein n=1 Tax=Palleronia sp. TaxID=1940284 RepID=UPI0035C83F3D
NTLNQYSLAVGSPLSALQRLLLCAMKVDQMVDAVLEEIAEGRKPMITFHSTNEALLREFAKGPEGRISDEAMAEATGLTLKDQIRRVHDSLYRVKDNDEVTDARDLYPHVRETAQRVEQMIEALPDSLAVSPLDALIERLEANGLAVGEISGRGLCYRDGHIQRRQGRKRRETIDAYNAGEIDVILFNQAGATGGSFHASPDFKDQRPRTQLEFETPLDIIKYIQALGRGNRYGQLHKPRVRAVSTGLTPEMRIDQQKNNKLRSVGASVDGNRAHPMLVEKVPDLLNKVGDQAARNVLVSVPAIARRLGFSEFAEDTTANAEGIAAVGNETIDEGAGGVTSGIESLANKAMVRSGSLLSHEQNEFMQRLFLEFEALIEELDSRNANPLKPKMLDGRVEIVATGIFSGQEAEEGDLSRSAFTSPLYISTGIHHFDEEAWNGDKLVEKVDECRRLYGSDGFKPYAERLTQNLPNLLRPLLPEGVTLEEAMEDPNTAGMRFRNKFEKMSDLAWVLENMVPGATIGLPMDEDDRGQIRRVIVGLVPPANPAHYDLPSAYKVDTVAPGFSKPERMSLSRIMSYRMETLRFGMGISDGTSASFLEEYDRASLVTRRLPVQILHGNILEAIATSAQHDLGSVSLYRDTEGRIHRGIVVQKAKINMEHLPVEVHSSRIAAELTYRYLEDRLPNELVIDRMTNRKTSMTLWGMMSPKTTPGAAIDADIRITMGMAFANFDLVPLRKTNRDWFAERPGLFEALYDKALPEKKDIRTRGLRGDNPNHAGFVRFDIRTEEGRRKAVQIISMLDDAGLMVSGKLRGAVNDVTNDMERMMGMNGAGHEIEDAEVIQEVPAPAQEGVDVAAQALLAAGVDQPDARRPVEEILARNDEVDEAPVDDLDMDDIQW